MRAPKKARSSRREIRVGFERQQNVAQQRARVTGRERKARGRHEVGLHVLSESHPRRRRQMIRNLSPIKRRRAAHGVDDMFVETREEPEPVFAWQPMLDRAHGAGGGQLMSARVLAVVDDGNAAGLASRQVAALEHNDLKAALDQFMRGAHASHAAAENDDPSRHSSSRRGAWSGGHDVDSSS